MSWVRIEPPTASERSEFLQKFRKKARFLVDETLGESFADVLREYKWNAKSVQEVGLAGRDDQAVFAYAWQERRFLVTQDHDFLDGRRFPFHRCQGVFVLPGGNVASDEFARAFLVMTGMFAPFSRGFVGWKIMIHGGNEVRIHRPDGSRSRYKIGRGDDFFEWESDDEQSLTRTGAT